MRLEAGQNGTPFWGGKYCLKLAEEETVMGNHVLKQVGGPGGLLGLRHQEVWTGAEKHKIVLQIVAWGGGRRTRNSRSSSNSH